MNIFIEFATGARCPGDEIFSRFHNTIIATVNKNDYKIVLGYFIYLHSPSARLHLTKPS